MIQASARTTALAAVDVLVNSAGITGPNAKLWDYPVEAWKQVFDVNVHGLFHCCRELGAHMKARGTQDAKARGGAGRRRTHLWGEERRREDLPGKSPHHPIPFLQVTGRLP